MIRWKMISTTKLLYNIHNTAIYNKDKLKEYSVKLKSIQSRFERKLDRIINAKKTDFKLYNKQLMQYEDISRALRLTQYLMRKYNV